MVTAQGTQGYGVMRWKVWGVTGTVGRARIQPLLSSSDCGHADVSNETANPDFYVRSLVFKCWQLSWIFVKTL